MTEGPDVAGYQEKSNAYFLMWKRCFSQGTLQRLQMSEIKRSSKVLIPIQDP